MPTIDPAPPDPNPHSGFRPKAEAQNRADAQEFDSEVEDSSRISSGPTAEQIQIRLQHQDGLFKLLLPWLYIVIEKMSFSLMEFWLACTLWAGAAGLIVSGVHAHYHLIWYYEAGIVYAIFHVYAVAFATALYYLKVWAYFPERFRPNRWVMLLGHFFVPSLFFLGVGICFHVAYK